MRKAVIFLGNGINQCSKGVSWSGLMKELRNMTSPPIADVPHYAKPYSMLFEEIVLSDGMDEKSIRLKIKEKLGNERPNDLHRKILDLPIADILTTNYDYTLEVAAEGVQPSIGGSPEKRYSLFRNHTVHHKGKTKRIWHLHGELNAHKSIQLGYDDYSGALEGLRLLVTKGRKETHGKSMTRRMWSWKGNEAKSDLISWADAFFSRDVYILGISLDFVEISLWWLLVYRAKHFNEKNKKYPARNKIFFYRFEPRPKSKENEVLLETIRKAQTDLLRAAGVNIVMLNGKDWASFYGKAIDDVASRITVA